MSFRSQAAGRPRPDRLTQVVLPTRQSYNPSPADWRDEVLYFLLVDRFSDGNEGSRPLLDRTNVPAARPAQSNGQPWRFDQWAQSGNERFQGGTLGGIRSQLAYLTGLGVSALWLSPVMRQRGHANTFGSDTYHGYGVADFLEVDPRFGTRQDLIDLVDAAHGAGIRIILDIIFNHTGQNWNYPGNVQRERFRPWPDHYGFGNWLGAQGEPISAITSTDQGAWPAEFQDPARYTRAGSGDLGAGALDDPHAENKRSDFEVLRDLATDVDPTLTRLVDVYKYWIALTDCDGFRIDTFKHVAWKRRATSAARSRSTPSASARTTSCSSPSHPATMPPLFALDGLRRNLNAVLDIGGARPALEAVGKGLAPQTAYFDGFNEFDPGLGSHRNVGDQHVSVLNDHDQLGATRLRFTPRRRLRPPGGCSRGHPAVRARHPDDLLRHGAGARTAGVFGTPVPPGLPRPGRAPVGPVPARGDVRARTSPTQRNRRPATRHPGSRPSRLRAVRHRRTPLLRPGAPGLPTHRGAHRGAVGNCPSYDTAGSTCVRSPPAAPSSFPGPGDLICWSRILDVDEALLVVNGHGNATVGPRSVLVDADLTGAGGRD